VITKQLEGTRQQTRSHPSPSRAIRRRVAWDGYWQATWRLFVVGGLTALVVAGALLLGRYGDTIDVAALARFLPSSPPVAINLSELLYHPHARGGLDAALLLLAPLALAAISGSLALGGSSWRRILCALVALAIAAFNLFGAVALVWIFDWNGATIGVISPGVYLALSASLGGIVLAFGVWHLTLARTLGWPTLRGKHARRVARCWVALVGLGAAALVGAAFIPWGEWSASGQRSLIVSPLTALVGRAHEPALALVAFFAAPTIATLAAWLSLRAPRWGRSSLAALGLLASAASLALGLFTLARLYLHGDGASALAPGGAVGIGASALILIAFFGLLSTPFSVLFSQPISRPHPAPTEPLMPPIVEPVLRRAPTTRRVTAIVSETRRKKAQTGTV
jgi:hypothetical protein